MKCSVFIASSADGYIATLEGSVDWLEGAGKKDVDLGEQADMGMKDYLASVDCLIMGRKSMEVIAGFNLRPEQWPYGELRIIVLSRTLAAAPENLKDKIEIYSGDIPTLIKTLEREGHQYAYIDGGTTITSFIKLELINEITITQIPILLGEGLPLFGNMAKRIKLEDAQAIVFPNDFIQYKYKVNYT